MDNFYGICVLCNSLVLSGVMLRLYMQVSRAEVTTSSNLDVFCKTTNTKAPFYVIKRENKCFYGDT